MKYCLKCLAERPAAEQDEQGRCAVCHNELLESGERDDASTVPLPKSGDEAEARRPRSFLSGKAWPKFEPKREEPPAAADPEPEVEEAAERPEPVPPAPVASPAAEPPEPAAASVPALTPTSAPVPEPPSAGPRREPVGATVRDDPEGAAGGAAETVAVQAVDYGRLVREVESNVREGYDLFGLVGGASSGKTHALKALTYLLRSIGAQSDRASFEFMKAPVPGQTGASAFHYDYKGPAGLWTFVDAGGELYARLGDNDWSREGASVKLSRWLLDCRGVFCFLHLRPGHFKSPALDVDPTLEEDEDTSHGLERQREIARDNQRELAFFRNFFLFLRAVRSAEGGLEEIVEHCRSRKQTLEEGLRDYESAPMLDVPVSFFLSQADSYAHEGKDFEVGDGRYVDPRRLDLPVPAFVARHLPTLFAAVNDQVRHYRFDFVQSYEEAKTGLLDEEGNPKVKTYWHADEGEGVPLSAGLLAGLEFVLRHPPGGGERPWWRPPALTTRQALLLHRRFHGDDWEGVPRSLLGGWRLSGGGG